jgi:(p)ppGpp synthase/HD superfamily hydrolase
MGETPSGAEKFETEENRASFHARLNRLGYSRGDDTFEKMDAAYDFSKEAHRPQVRKTGERYFEHPRSVALILLDECKIKDPNTIIASLLHDSVEDSPLFANRTQSPSQWEQIAYKRLGAQFNQEVAGIIISLTKPTVDGKELKSKDEAHDYYLKNLTGLSESENAKILLVKMSDRLHNLRTSINLEDKLKDKIIKETEKDYFPLFESFWSKYDSSKDKDNGANFASAGKYMLEKMKEQVETLQNAIRQ